MQILFTIAIQFLAKKLYCNFDIVIFFIVFTWDNCSEIKKNKLIKK